MEIKEIGIDELIPYDKNPRINQDAVEFVMKSIKANGFNQPLVVNQDKVICVGHTRLLAAKELGIKKVPCYMKEMTKAQFIAYNLADNKTSEYSGWDNELLTENLLELIDLDEEWLEATAFDSGFIEKLVGKEEDDYSDSNKEIDTESYGSHLQHKCPRCQFEFGKK